MSKSKTYIERIFTRADIKFVKSLGERSFRYANKLFVAEGNKSVQDILTSGIKVSRIFCLESWFNHNYLNLPKSIEITFIHQKDLDQLTTLKSTREVLAIGEMQTLWFNPKTLEGLALAVDTLQDPGNLGTIIRLADWYGIKTILCSEPTVDCYNTKTIQATMGSIGRVNIFYGDLAKWFSEAALPVIAAEMDGIAAREFTFPKNCILLIGNEGQGISKELKDYIHHSITIEKRGNAESLNAAMAATILVDRYFGQAF